MWLVNTFVGDLKQNQLIGHIQEMASFIAFSLIHLLAFFKIKRMSLYNCLVFEKFKIEDFSFGFEIITRS
jgi:hypothetical protein